MSPPEEAQAGRPDADAALALLAEVHAYPSGEDYAREYPTVFGQPNGARLATALEGERAVACAAALPGWVEAPGGGPQSPALGLARIGSVATAPGSRGRGLASSLVMQLHRELHAEGMAVAALWAERGGLYARLGYAPVGSAWLTPAAPLPQVPFRPGLRITPWRPGMPLCPRGGMELRRSEVETRALGSIPGVEGVVGLREGSVCAHALVGKGRDMQGIIHDWAGALEDVLALVGALQGSGARLMMTPATHPILARLPPPVTKLPMAWMSILDRAALLQWAATRLEARPQLSALEDGPLLQALFGAPPDAAAPAPGLLPLFIWGLDSI